MLESLLILRTHLRVIRPTVGGEDDLRAIRRPGTFRIIALGASQISRISTDQISLVDLVIRIVIPGITTLFSRCSEIEFLLHFRIGLRVFMGGGVEHLFVGRMNPGTGGLTFAGRNPVQVTGLQIQ